MPDTRNIARDHPLLSYLSPEGGHPSGIEGINGHTTKPEDHRNSDRSPSGRTGSLCACIAFRLYGAGNPDPWRHLVRLLSDLSLGANACRPNVFLPLEVVVSPARQALRNLTSEHGRPQHEPARQRPGRQLARQPTSWFSIRQCRTVRAGTPGSWRRPEGVFGVVRDRLGDQRVIR